MKFLVSICTLFAAINLGVVTAAKKCDRQYFGNFEKLPTGAAPPLGFLGLNWDGWEVTTSQNFLPTHSGANYVAVRGPSSIFGTLSVNSSDYYSIFARVKSFWFGCSGILGSGLRGPAECTMAVSSFFPSYTTGRNYKLFTYTPDYQSQNFSLVKVTPGLSGSSLNFVLLDTTGISSVYIDDMTFDDPSSC